MCVYCFRVFLVRPFASRHILLILLQQPNRKNDGEREREEKRQQMPKEKRRRWKSLSKFILINFCYADECKGISRSIQCVWARARTFYKIHSHFRSAFFRIHAPWFVCVELNFIDFFYSRRRHRRVSLVSSGRTFHFFSSAHQPVTKQKNIHLAPLFVQSRKMLWYSYWAIGRLWNVCKMCIKWMKGKDNIVEPAQNTQMQKRNETDGSIHKRCTFVVIIIVVSFCSPFVLQRVNFVAGGRRARRRRPQNERETKTKLNNW